jgi:hypothetical protein
MPLLPPAPAKIDRLAEMAVALRTMPYGELVERV